MRKLIVSIILTTLVMSAIAQAPQGISHQLVIRNNFNRLVTNAPVGIKLSILQGSEVGPVIYSETHNLTSNTNGMVSFTIGQGSVLSGVFSNINWASGSYFIRTEADPAGANNYSITGTSQALSVPYALHANTAQNLAMPITETDPVFGSSPAGSIASGDITNWNIAYQWGDHAGAGYVGSSRMITINGVAQNLSANRTWNVGTVTSIGLALPDIFNVSDTPVTGSGTISANLITQNANLVLASPNETSGTPAFRPLLAADIPDLDWSKITTGKPTTISGYGITDAVRTSGNQTVGGTKTFTSIVVANSGVDAGTNRITNMANPTDAQDAVTKSYFDNIIGQITETDPIFGVSASATITSGDITNWNIAYQWGDHAGAGYVGSSRTITINGVTQNLSANRTWNVGTVTSIGLALPNIFSVSDTPVTGSGTISASLMSQNGNLVLASPNGTPGTPSFRTLLAGDIPNLDWSKITTGKPTTISGYGIADAVTTSGNQIIAGTKTFSSTIVANAGLNAGNSRITNMANPLNSQDAVTKSYLETSIGLITETDPIFGVSAAATITTGEIINWNSAYLWGDHAGAGYIGSSRTITINGVAQNLSANRTWNVGTVTSIGLALPNIFSVSDTPVTGSGTISANLVTQNANLVLASPNETSGTPSFRTLLAADIPNLDWSKITTGKPTTISGYGITDAVTTSGNQTIDGTKTFSNAILANAGMNAGNSRITNMANPVNNQDAVTKAYFDSNKIQNGTSAGQMLYWSGSAWMVIPPGSNGQSLVFCNGVPSWGGCIPEVTTSAITNNTGITATGGGNVIQDGGQPVTQRGVCWGTIQNPTITSNDGITIDGAGVGSFTSSLTGLSVLTSYYVRAYAINEIGVSYGNQVQFTTPQWTCGISAIGDADGNVYNTVVIGTQCWMSQNLNTGQQVSVIPSNNGIIEKYCMQNLIANCDEYGALYSWNELMNYGTAEGIQGICPAGWHIPAKSEFEALTTYLGGTTVAGGKMKETGNIHWNSNVGATNESGFTAFGGGYYNSLFIGFKSTANFATSTGSGSDFFHTRLYNSSATHDLLTISKAAFVSVRCVKN